LGRVAICKASRMLRFYAHSLALVRWSRQCVPLVGCQQFDHTWEGMFTLYSSRIVMEESQARCSIPFDSKIRSHLRCPSCERLGRDRDSAYLKRQVKC
jgi:hypothetical protein